MSTTRPLNFWYSQHIDSGNATGQAADEIINSPETHLLSQGDLYSAEGGVLGTAL